jgi:hypothetical protein
MATRRGVVNIFILPSPGAELDQYVTDRTRKIGLA